MRQLRSILVHISLFPSHKRSQRNAKHHWRVQRHTSECDCTFKAHWHIQDWIALLGGAGEKKERERKERKMLSIQNTIHNIYFYCVKLTAFILHTEQTRSQSITHTINPAIFFPWRWFLEKLKITWCKWCRGWCSWIYKLGWKVWHAELDYTV